MESRSDAAVKVPKGVESFRPESSSGMTAYFPDIPIKTVYVRLGSRLCKNSPFSKIEKYLPLQQRSSCICLLDMQHHGSIVAVVVSMPTFKNHFLFSHSRAGSGPCYFIESVR